MAGKIEDFSDVEDISGKNSIHAEDNSDVRSVKEILREKNHLHLKDYSTVVKMGKTGVFWDAVDYPFPPSLSLSPDDIYQKIESALRDCREGEDENWDYLGEKTIWVYVDDKEGSWGGDYLKKKTWESRIYFLPGGDKSGRRNRMIHDIYLWTMDFPVIYPRPSSLVLVSDQVKDDIFSFRVLQNLSCRRFRVFLATRPDSYRPEIEVKWPASLLDVVYSFGEEGDVSFNRPHNIKKFKATLDGKDVEDILRKKKKCLHIEDFSAVVEGGQLGVIWYSLPRENKDFDCYERPISVFWNVKQCPISSSAMLPCVISNIESALYEMGFHSPVEIYAYGDKPDQRDVFKETGICYGVEDEHLRSDPIVYDEMAVDLILCATPTYESPAILVVIPKPDPDSELHRVLKCVQSRNHEVLLVMQPVDGSGLFDSAESVVQCTQGLDGGEPISRPICGCDIFR